MTIKTGDPVPDASLALATADGPKPIELRPYLAGRKVVLFAVPGAFTPTCSERHMPGFIEHAAAIRAKGVDEIACVSVNDPFVMRAWADKLGIKDEVTMIADGSASLTHALGTELDLTSRGLGIRSQRYAMIIDDGVVRYLGVEPGGEVGVSGAASVLEALE